jgi:hypothetical protein
MVMWQYKTCPLALFPLFSVRLLGMLRDDRGDGRALREV